MVCFISRTIVVLIYIFLFSIGISKLFVFAESTQLEDPRQEWRAIQEAMLREYLQTAQDVLEVRVYIFSLAVILPDVFFSKNNYIRV